MDTHNRNSDTENILVVSRREGVWGEISGKAKGIKKHNLRVIKTVAGMYSTAHGAESVTL